MVGMTQDQIHGELDSISMSLLTLSQDLIKAKLELEEQTKLGFIGMAQSRKLMGGMSSVSHLQFPSEDATDFTARFKIKRDGQKLDYQDYQTPDTRNANFNYFSLEDTNVDQVVEDLDSKFGMQNRRNQKDEDMDSSEAKKDVRLSKDPIKWFGVLVPTALRQTQSTFVRALELSIDCANIQSQIQSNLGRKNYLLGQITN